MNPLKVVITGATGFIGSKLCEAVLNDGGTVYAIVRRATVNHSRLPQHPRLTIIEGDIQDVTSWGGVLKHGDTEFNAFFHLAWDGVANAYRNNEVQINNLGPVLKTINLAKDLGCKTWIGTGSQAEYGPLNMKISEDGPNKPSTLYGSVKLAAGNMAVILGREVGIPCQWVRIFSTYGPGDNHGWMLSDVITHLLDGVSPKLTPGEQLWDYLHVADAAEALKALAKSNPSSSEIYNLGSGSSQTIRSIVEKARDLINPNKPILFGAMPYRPDQVMHLEANIDKLKYQTGWSPRVDLDMGLSETIEYIRSLKTKSL